MNLTSVIITRSETFSLILLINRCYCNIQNSKFEKTIAVLISFVSTMCEFLRKYDERRLQNKERINV